MTFNNLPTFNYDHLSEQNCNLLKKYTLEIRFLIETNLKSAARIGEIFFDVKTNILEYGQWQRWINTEFGINIEDDSADNFINLYLLAKNYAGQHNTDIVKLRLQALYNLERNTVEPDLRAIMLDLAKAEVDSITKEEIQSVINIYRKLRLAESNIDRSAADLLINSSIADDLEELMAISRLSKNKQLKVSTLIANGVASSVKDALDQLNP